MGESNKARLGKNDKGGVDKTNIEAKVGVDKANKGGMSGANKGCIDGTNIKAGKKANAKAIASTDNSADGSGKVID